MQSILNTDKRTIYKLPANYTRGEPVAQRFSACISLREHTYTDLHIYELHDPAKAITWVSNTSMCLAGNCADGRSELLHIEMPLRMTLAGANKDLCKDRDFRVLQGGFHSKHIASMVSFNTGQAKLLCSASEDRNDVVIWTLGSDGNDLIEEKSVLRNTSEENTCPSQLAKFNDKSTIAFGTHMSNICIVDPNTMSTVCSTKGFDNHQALSKICASGTNTLIVCEKDSGHLSVLDMRMNCKYKDVTHSKGPNQTVDVSFTFDVSNSGNDAMVLSNTGHVTCYDLRQNEKTKEYHLNLGSEVLANASYAKIQISPNKSGYFSVSGLDKHMHVFSTNASTNKSPVQKAAEATPLSPVFTHRGHLEETFADSVSVLNHLWHPEKDNLIISTASDGGLQAWEFIER